ncbi:MAG: hypothetical protein WA961_12750 [Rhodanobacter sp.]|jgi:hypothetical protein
MHRKTLLASALVALLAGSATFAMAQDTAPPPSTAQTTITKQTRILPGDRDHGMAGHRMHHRQHSGVIGDLRAMERLYQQAGRGKEMAAVYNDVLARSQDPRVRDYVHKRLARLQAQPANVDQAIATLRKSLDENLANEAKMRAEREKMRAAWQKRASETTTPAK